MSLHNSPRTENQGGTNSGEISHDRQNLAVIMSLFAAPLFHYLMVQMRKYHEAEDATQNIFLNFWRVTRVQGLAAWNGKTLGELTLPDITQNRQKRPKDDGPPGSAAGLAEKDVLSATRAYLFRAAYNEGRLYLRKLITRREVTLENIPEPSSTSPPSALLQLEMTREGERKLRLLRRMLREELSPALRRVFVLRHFGQCRQQEIADILGIKLGTVKSRLSKANTILELPRKKTRRRVSASTTRGAVTGPSSKEQEEAHSASTRLVKGENHEI
jgi:RNA polymerase sigma factor (sigma-70 family)